MKLHLGITSKLTLVFVLFAAVLLTTVGTLSYDSGRAALQAATISELLATTSEKQAALESWIEERQAAIAGLAGVPGIAGSVAAFIAADSAAPPEAPTPPALQAARARVLQELNARVGPERRYLVLLVLDPATGTVIAATDPREEGTLKADQPFFINGKRGPYMQSLHYSLMGDSPMMIASAPLMSPEGQLLAVLVGHLQPTEVNTIVGRLAGQHETEDAFLVDSASQFVTEPRFISDPVVLRRVIQTEASKRCLVGDNGALLTDDYRGVPAIVVYRWLPEHQICLIVKVDQAEALAPARDFGAKLLLIGGLALLVASFLAFGLARTITRPILALQGGAMRFGRGELDLRLPETSGDELGLLAHELNSMAAALAEKETLLRDHATQLEQEVQRRTAELARSNNDLQQFAYIASHDLQEPLRMVSSYTQLLAKRYRGQLDADADEFIGYAVDGTLRMQTLISDILSYSRVETRAKPFELIDCAAVLDRTLKHLGAVIDESGAVVTHDRLPTLPADAVQLAQLFQNLIGNAIKFRGPEPPRVHIAAERCGEEWRFSVCDNGIGIDPQYAERIFVMFQRLHTRAEYPGTGIGLAICKRIIERHGGRIWMESQAGQGARFCFTIPCKRST
jgi:signal transduction histidine kinase